MTTDDLVHFAVYGATNAVCDETVPRSVTWDVILSDHASRRFTSRRARVTCPECRWRVGLDLRPLPLPLPLVCAEEHGYECCGCIDHPAGKPWGWNSQAWNEHFPMCLGLGPLVTREEFEAEARAKTRAQFTAPKKLVIRVNSGPKMSRGKYAAQAVHAALTLLGVHPGTPVVVLGGTKTEIGEMPIKIHDAGRTEVEPGTLTAGAMWAPDEPPNDEVQP